MTQSRLEKVDQAVAYLWSHMYSTSDPGDPPSYCLSSMPQQELIRLFRLKRSMNHKARTNSRATTLAARSCNNVSTTATESHFLETSEQSVNVLKSRVNVRRWPGEENKAAALRFNIATTCRIPIISKLQAKNGPHSRNASDTFAQKTNLSLCYVSLLLLRVQIRFGQTRAVSLLLAP